MVTLHLKKILSQQFLTVPKWILIFDFLWWTEIIFLTIKLQNEKIQPMFIKSTSRNVIWKRRYIMVTLKINVSSEISTDNLVTQSN